MVWRSYVISRINEKNEEKNSVGASWPMNDLAQQYHQDFCPWLANNAALQRAGQATAVDLIHIAEELEGMGKSQHHAFKQVSTSSRWFGTRPTACGAERQ